MNSFAAACEAQVRTEWAAVVKCSILSPRPRAPPYPPKPFSFTVTPSPLTSSPNSGNQWVLWPFSSQYLLPWKSVEGSYWVVSPLRAGRRAGRQAPICPWVSEASVLPRDTEPFSPPPPIPSSDWVLGRWRGENNTPLLDRSGKHFYNPPSAGKSLPTPCPEVSSKPGGDIWVGLLIPSLPLPAFHPVFHS